MALLFFFVLHVALGAGLREIVTSRVSMGLSENVTREDYKSQPQGPQNCCCKKLKGAALCWGPMKPAEFMKPGRYIRGVPVTLLVGDRVRCTSALSEDERRYLGKF